MIDQISENKPDQPKDEPATISFGELCKPRNTSRFVASQAFSHVLQLATMGMVKVEQSGAYDPIELQPLVAHD